MRVIEIFKLMGSIFIDNDEANKSISKTEEKTEGLGNKFLSGIGTAAKWGAAIGGAAIAGATALFKMADKGAEATDRVDKLSQKIGISRTAFQQWDYILSQNGASIESLQVGMKTMVQRMQESADGTGKGAEAYDKLNISVTDLNGNLKSQEDVFDETARALMGMPEGAEKSKLAFELFGKAGLELMPLLNGTEESLDDLKQAASDMGLVLSDEAIDAGVNFTDMKDNVVRSLGAVTANIGVQLMPMFMKMFDWVMDNMPEIQRIIGVVMDWIGKFVMIVVDIFKDYLIPIMQAVFDWVKENWPIIQSIFEAVFGAIKLVWDNVLAPTLNFLWEVIKAIVQWVSDNWPTIQKTFETVFNAIKAVWDNVLKPVLEFVWAALKKIWDFVSEHWPKIQSTFETVFKAIKWVWDNVLKAPLQAVWDAMKKIVDFVADKFKPMQDTVENVFDAIGTAVKKVTDFFSKLYDGVKKAVDKIKEFNNTPQNPTTSSNPNTKNRLAGQSFAVGTDYIPYDNFPAILHKGEAVLTAEENKAYQKGSGGVSINNLSITIPAKDVLEFKNVTEFFNKIGQVAKAGVVSG